MCGCYNKHHGSVKQVDLQVESHFLWYHTLYVTSPTCKLNFLVYLIFIEVYIQTEHSIPGTNRHILQAYLTDITIDLCVMFEKSLFTLFCDILYDEKYWQGAFVSLCDDGCVHLWSIRQKQPEIVHSLQFQKEK